MDILKRSALITGFVILALTFIVYLLPSDAVTRSSQTTLTVDYPLALTFNSSENQSNSQEERNILVITHQYSPDRIMVFEGRNYFNVHGFQYSFDAQDAERLDGFPTYFLTREKEDRIAPIVALFSVNWRLEGRRDGSDHVLDEGSFEGKVSESLKETNKISGKTRLAVDFDSLNSKLALEEGGIYVLEMKSSLNYTFLAQNNVSGRANYIVFRAEVNYTKGKPEQINLYYPLNSVKENVSIEQPLMIMLRQNVLIFAGIGIFLIGISLLMRKNSPKEKI